ncbi:hypothetical protein JW868_04655 [Candidatus Woesearchaeota archaeon]|nr:hypothetical protein [Candidatus Woesearchaeota archaeon]
MTYVYSFRKFQLIEPKGDAFGPESGFLVRTAISPNQQKELVRAETPTDLGAAFADYLKNDHYHMGLGDSVIFTFQGDLESMVHSQHRKSDWHVVTYQYLLRPLDESEVSEFLKSYVGRNNHLTSPSHK